MRLPSRLLAVAASVLGPAVVPLLRRAVNDPEVRRQVVQILGQLRSGAAATSPSARAALRLQRDLDALVALAGRRADIADDDDERARTQAWLREAVDARAAADIVRQLTGAERRSMVIGIEQRRVSLLRRMLAGTLHADEAIEG